MEDERFDKLLAVAGRVFGGPVTAADSFHGLGGDSLKAVALMAGLEEETAIEVDTFEMISAASFGDFFRSYLGVVSG
ncbi:acyl carrier protein [Kutzneria sp. CA-103260]|uniref:acyl carrier protein n=1 Tax=Kutzneria sp. CA-103260 TaxID=2802641 RepID=UPI001BAD015B|nr:acyl carrier protein [Kutzneria sp. CA-103260]QUQ67034.1 Phosphopantetheine attachment site [Kutzneria sp. CA-103260]